MFKEQVKTNVILAKGFTPSTILKSRTSAQNSIVEFTYECTIHVLAKLIYYSIAILSQLFRQPQFSKFSCSM